MDPAQTFLAAYAAAVHAKDAAAFADLYAEEVRIFDLWATWSYDGQAAWRQMVDGWFGSLGNERVAVRFAEVQSSTSGDLCVIHAFVTYEGQSATGEPLRAMQNRATYVLRQQPGGAWKVIHEHSSAPADEQGKVQLQRA